MKQSSLLALLSTLEDHRMDRKKEHLMVDIIAITISAVVCGADTWNQIEVFGNSKIEWFKTFLELPNGIPSHDTFNRFFSQMCPDKFEAIFREWVQMIARKVKNEVISIDGKTIRGAKHLGEKSPIHMVSAWASENNLVLGQLKVDEKSNEITAIPKLLDALFIEDAIITIDAMGCQTDIAEKIRNKKAEYILAVKGNQKTLQENIKDSLLFVESKDISETIEGDHGRIETRKCIVLKDLSHIENVKKWKDLKTLIIIESERNIKSTGVIEKSRRMYISSLDENADTFQKLIRAHWGIENNLHWSLDVSFHEDESRKRAGNSAQNFSGITKIALNLIKNETTLKASMMTKRLKAGWDENYLNKILGF